MRELNDTIAAVATSAGEGGIAIVRISGENALSILKKLFVPAHEGEFEHGRMRFGRVKDSSGQTVDEVMAVFFASPNSYTRQDVAEIHTHGGRVCGEVLRLAVECGARAADRGEFTYRAFMNGRIDLSRAEAVMSLISAGSERARRASVNQLEGGVSAMIGRAREKLNEAASLIDAAADFPEEIDEDVTFTRVRGEAEKVLAQLERMADKRYAHITENGANVVIAGRPNAGKSSIMNALLSCERSIVTEIPGTTRDSVSESTFIRGLRVTLTDTAGIRETGDKIEKIGVERARALMDRADCVVLVLDGSESLTQEDEELLSMKDSRFVVAVNKNDRGCVLHEDGITVSAATGEGIGELTDAIYEAVSAGEDDEKLVNLRHVDCAARAAECLRRVCGAPEGTFLDLLRDDILRAADILGEITGENVTENTIDEIFSRFCVGK